MFRRKKENRAKLEHKLYLARENPEPTFDLSECGIHDVPNGVYSLCRVFLKERLYLQHNALSSLSGGGSLKDLHLLKVLDLRDNSFSTIPDEIEVLVSLTELYLNDNHIKKLPSSLCKLKRLRILDISNNLLKKLPEDMGNLVSLHKLSITGNTNVTHLPKSICHAQHLQEINLDFAHFVYPPASVAHEGIESIMKYICDDTGFNYVSPDTLEDEVDGTQDKETSDLYDDSWKEQRLQDFLEIEKNNELLQRQEFEMATAMKANREKLLSDISQQQSRLDKELAKVQQVKECERFSLIEQLQEAEQNADRAVTQLLAFNKEPLLQLLEQERLEEQRLLVAASKYNETFHKSNVLEAMHSLLEQETERFKQYDESRSEATRSILEQEMYSGSHLANILHKKDFQKAELVCQLQEDEELQKIAVGALLERVDGRSWGLVQQVRLVESQLAALTVIELDRRKLELNEQVNDLAEKRSHLSALLMELLFQQEQRRAQLLLTLKTMEESNTMEDFWLRQYQQLLERMPLTVTEAQKNINPSLIEAFLMTGVLHYLPFLAHLLQSEGNLLDITDDDLKSAGITHTEYRQKILEALHIFCKEYNTPSPKLTATAPPLEEASAPLGGSIQNASECVVCMETDCEVIFVPCGHLCCCVNCADALTDCPMCRANIERKIRVYTN